MAEADKLRLTTEGQQALMDANNSGVHIRPKSFKVGDYAGPVTEDVPSNILGNLVHSGNISYIEVLDGSTSRFTIEIPKGVPVEDSATVGELCVYLETGICLGHLTYSEPMEKHTSRAIRIEFMLHLAEAYAASIDVTFSEFGSIPSIAELDALPSPLNAMSNAISILNLYKNADDTYSPGLAVRYGDGGQYWSFLGHARLFSGNIGADNVVSPSEFMLQSVVDTFNLQNDDAVIVQAISGPGAGQTRHFNVQIANEQGTFVAADDGFTALDPGTVIAIWQSVQRVGAGANFIPYPEESDDIPEEWILKRGKTVPVWAPSTSSGKGSNNTLYIAPGKLKIKPQLTVTETDKLRYDLTEELNNNNDALVSLQGLNQHRQAFHIERNVLELAGDPGVGILLDIRSFVKEVHTGCKVNIHTNHHVSDGLTREYALAYPVEKPEDVFATVGSITQALNAYVIDVDAQTLIFTESPAAGTAIELAALEYEDSVGYSTKVVTSNYTTYDYVDFITLPVEPQSKDQVRISQNGLVIHKDQYSLVENRIIFSGQIAPSRQLEVMIFHNVKAEGSPETNLVGMVTDAIVTSKYIQLLRHSDYPINMPIPEFTMQGGSGIRVVGTYPEFTIESDIADTLSKDKFQSLNLVKNGKNVEEVLVTQRIEFSGNIQIQVTADFSAKLGPGFQSDYGLEEMQYVVGYQTPKSTEPDYARKIKGTDEAGFSVSRLDGTDMIAYSNASMTQSFNVVKANHPAGYIDIVAKVRVVKANVTSYGSYLNANLSILVLPEL